ncbi:MAG: hypothetical protein KKC55_05160 [Gammaproteobacteria bacterium]|nr:hypothetical protein [Gammaproteobacteria bacterium]
MTHDATPLSQQYWYQTTSMDLRSLALFRVALAIALGCTLASLMGAVPLWFSDGGMMPRTDSLDLGGLAAHNLTLVTGDTALLRLMLGVGLMASFTLMLGYRTRFSLGVATLVLFSFVTRQPLISLPHEVWLVGLALWSLSLPLGLRWSLDATLGQTLAPGASDTRRGGLIGLSWALQWLALAGAALTIPVQDTAASLAIAGAIALLLALVSRGLLPTPSPWRWATPMLALGGALGGSHRPPILHSPDDGRRAGSDPVAAQCAVDVTGPASRHGQTGAGFLRSGLPFLPPVLPRAAGPADSAAGQFGKAGPGQPARPRADEGTEQLGGDRRAGPGHAALACGRHPGSALRVARAAGAPSGLDAHPRSGRCLLPTGRTPPWPAGGAAGQPAAGQQTPQHHERSGADGADAVGRAGHLRCHRAGALVRHTAWAGLHALHRAAGGHPRARAPAGTVGCGRRTRARAIP